MYNVEMHEPSDQFRECWYAAGRHLQSQVQDGLSWLKAVLTPPFLEHMSFRVGNQLFFVRIEPTDESISVPGTRIGLDAIAQGCNGHACLLPMSRERQGWTAQLPGWGLIDLYNGRPLDPLALVTEELIEMTEWEVHDFAVQVVRDSLVKDGRTLMSFCGNPGVDPAIWFVGDEGPEWVVVRAATYPTSEASLPHNIARIAESCGKLSEVGHFASVAISSAKQASAASGGPAIPLWRGHAMYVRYEGLHALGAQPQ